MVTTADFQVNVHIRDIVAAYNSVLFKSDGINLWIIMHREANNFWVQITNLTSMYGKQLNATPHGGSNSVGYSVLEFRERWCVYENLHAYILLSQNDSSFSHNSVAVNIVVYVPQESINFRLHNCSFSNNEVHLQFVNFERKSSTVAKDFPIILLDNCNFSRSNIKHHLTDSINIHSTYVIINNCQFYDNYGTAIAAYNTHLYFSGNISFSNNTAYNGGALAFWANSFMHIDFHLVNTT